MECRERERVQYVNMCMILVCALRIKELCQQFPQGITDQVIQNDMPHVEAQQRAMAINRLLSVVSI